MKKSNFLLDSAPQKSVEPSCKGDSKLSKSDPGLRALVEFQRHITAPTGRPVLSTDNDPLYRSPQWQANLRVLEVTEIKTVPSVPYPIRLWSGSSKPYAANAWTARCFGPRPTWWSSSFSEKAVHRCWRGNERRQPGPDTQIRPPGTSTCLVRKNAQSVGTFLEPF